MDRAIDLLIARLAPHKGRWRQLADESEVSVHTLRKIAQGHRRNPTLDNVEKIRRTLDRWEAR